MIGIEAIFLLSVGCTPYAVVGYPALLAVLAPVRPRPVRKRSLPRRVTVLLPVSNGMTTLSWLALGAVRAFVWAAAVDRLDLQRNSLSTM